MGIKTKAPKDVNSSRRWLAALACGLAALAAPRGASVAAEPTLLRDPSQPPVVPNPADILPEIQARDFAVKISKRSTSGRTYLFDDPSDAKTHPGKILLLRREAEPVMAFRVVKTYPDLKQFAAKRVRRYGDLHVLDPGDSFMALEKVGDVELPPPTAQDKADLKELEGGAEGEKPPAGAAAPTVPVQPFDPDLDAATSPPPAGGVDTGNSGANPRSRDDDEDPEAHLGMTVDEVYPLDPNSQWLTGGFGFFRNSGANGGSAYFAGGGLRYGLTLGKMVFLRRAHVQDSFVVEGGVFYYKIINFQTSNDSYGVVPLIGTVRYNVLFGENFGIFFYGGLVQNNVTSVSGGTDETKIALSAAFPAAGGGMLFRVGPSWDARVDLGLDTVGAGLTLRF